MIDCEKTAAAPHLQEFLRSDLLPHLVGLIRAFPSLPTLFPQLLQLRFVIDANIVHGELRWRLKSRKNPTARTALHEALVCGVLAAYAPMRAAEQYWIFRIFGEGWVGVVDLVLGGSYSALRTRRRNKSKLARPYMERLINFSL